MEAIYDIPERLFIRPTPWCAGCSHGTIVKICCEVIQEMGLEDTLTWGGGAGCSGFACSSTGFDPWQYLLQLRPASHVLSINKE